MKKYFNTFLFPVIAVILSSIFPAIFLYCNNSDEAAFSEILPVIFIFSLIGICLFIVCFLFFRKPYKASLIALLFSILLLNYALIETGVKLILPNAKYWHIVPVSITLLLHIAYFIYRYLSDDNAQMITHVLCLVFSVLIVINVATSIPGMLNRIQAEKKLNDETDLPITTNVSDQTNPNFYWIVFDEYSGFRQMEEYYRYENVILKDYLADNQFSVSFTTRNESIMTSTVLTNISNLNYVVDNYTTESDKEVLRKQGDLFKILREHGYSTRALEVGSFFGMPTPLEKTAASDKAVTASGENLGDISIEQTIIYPFYNPNATDAISGIMEIVNYMSSSEGLEPSNTFTIVYLNIPHEPFLVNEHGQPTKSDAWNNWDDDRYYLGQYKYATTLMIQMIENILENDPDSIIVLQSDHGARASTDDSFMVKFPLEVMSNPLNAVYYRGEKLDIEGLSSVNTMRLVISTLLSEPYEMLPVPEDVYVYK